MVSNILDSPLSPRVYFNDSLVEKTPGLDF